VQSFAISVILLVLLVGIGTVAIVTIRSKWLRTGDDRGDWEKTLVDYKNLRDEGVLSEEEYRKIRTLVEPHMRSGKPGLPGRQQPSTGHPAGPGHHRN
jgi:hypothetical protein